MPSPPWDAAVLAEAGEGRSELVVPGLQVEEGAPIGGVSLRTVPFRVLETLEGTVPGAPFLIRFLHDASPEAGFPAVEVAAGRRCLLLLRQGGDGWELVSPREGLRDAGDGGPADARRLLASARERAFRQAPGSDREAVMRLVDGLRADAWEEREQASARLRAMGPGVVPLLRAVQRDERDSEVLARLTALFVALDVRRWRGWYLQRGQRFPFLVDLTQEGGGGAFLGRGREPRIDWGPRNADVMTFSVRGAADPRTGRFRFLKTYDAVSGGGAWEYEGTLLNDATVHGMWGRMGWFVMWREEGGADRDAKAAPAAPR